MMQRPGPSLRWSVLAVLACVCSIPAIAAPAKKKSAKAVAHSTKTAAKSGSKGKKTAVAKGKRVPRTLRTVHVNPAIRENAVMRVEDYLTETASSPFLYPQQMQGFFQALSAEQAERKAGGTPAGTVRILQFGDSHTAADIFTGQMRENIQQQFGDGGLGFQFAGHPFAGYKLAGSLRSQTAGWFTEGNKFNSLGDGDLGLGGLSISTNRPGESITLETSCSKLELHYLQQAGGGRITFYDNGDEISTIATATEVEGDPNAAGTFSYACSPGQHDFQFTTDDQAPVKLLGVVTEQPGVTYECLGINGASAPLMLRWNQQLFTDYLKRRAPNLIVLAYGTNESSISSEDRLETYQQDFERILDTLHRVAPEASVLVLGPADRGMAVRRAWKPFAGTARIIEMQKEACRTHGCAYWDTRRRMGGFGSMAQWVTAGWAQPDRTHLTGTGYRALADALYADLIHAYNLYQQHPEIQESRNGQAPRHP
ncbi:MAG TPA: GDSL-type esterase/lipase family protein [Granulicella sp.]